MKSTRRPTRSFFTLALIAITLSGLAASTSQASWSICVLRDMDDQLATAGAFCSSPGNYTYPTRAFGSTLDSYGSGTEKSFYINGPGIVAPEEASELGAGFQLLPTETEVYFNFKAFALTGGTQTNLAYWDGTGDVHFSPVATGYSMQIYKTIGPTTLRATVDGAATDVEGFAIAKTCDAGGIHEHPSYSLDGDGFAPAEGFYLFSMEIAMPGMKTTAPCFVVMETDQAPLMLDTAVAWVDNNIDSLTSVPEPSCWMLLVGVGLGLVWLRKKSHPSVSFLLPD